MADSSEITKNIQLLRHNPAAVQKLIYDELEAQTEGAVRMINAGNPVAFTVESGIMMGCSAMMQSETLLRRQYSSLSLTDQDLYQHMSDEDYGGRFSVPGITNYRMIIQTSDLIGKAVQVPGTNMKKIRIPKHTEVSVAQTKFTMQYPIDIFVMPNGGFRVVWDGDDVSPIQTLTTNIIDSWTTIFEGSEFLVFDFRIYQMGIKSFSASLNYTTGFVKTYEFEDQFFYARAYMSVGGQWQEIRTTHSDQVYDPTKPTLALKVVGNELVVMVPQIYLSNQTITQDIRIDIYTTKGEIDMNLDLYTPGSFSVIWRDNDEVGDNAYSAPLSTLVTSIWSQDPVTGGKNAMSFTELRNRVIENTLGLGDIPIVPQKLEGRLNDLGYDLVLDSDTVTKRVYLASRHVPAANGTKATTPGNTTVATYQSTLNALIGLETTYWNSGDRLVINPTTLYRRDNGIIKVVPKSEVDAIHALSADNLTNVVNSGDFLYSPFHYIVDVANNRLVLRPYHLTAPEIKSRLFVDENTSTGVSVAISDYQITTSPDGDGYYLEIATSSDDAFKALDHAGGQVSVQLSFIPPGSEERAVLTGIDTTPIDAPERTYLFFIETNNDIGPDHRLLVESFHQYNPADITVPMDLETTFDVIFVAKDYHPIGLQTTAIDQLVVGYELGSYTEYTGMLHNRLSVKFGDYLEGLWQRSRTVAGEEIYARYPADVPAFYGETQFKLDINGAIEMGWDPIEEEVTYTTIHNAGDPVLVGGAQLDTTEAALEDQNILTFTDAEFTSADEGKMFCLLGGGEDGVSLIGVIDEVIGPTEIRLSVDLIEAIDAGTLFEYGTQALTHAEGDVILDGEGNPTYEEGFTARGLVRQLDLFLIDGVYYFANDNATLQYRDSMVSTVVYWVSEDIPSIEESMLEETELYLHPKATIGTITAIVDDGREIKMDAEQSLVLRFYVNDDVYRNPKVRNSLEMTAKKVIVDELTKPTVSVSQMKRDIHELVGESILGVDIRGLGGGYNLQTLTVKDNSMSPSIAKKLVVLPDQSLAVEDNLIVDFVRHRGSVSE